MDLRQVRYFVAVAEELHFGRAANRLFLTQPALSQAVQRLERDLGFDLLVRSSRSVALTEAGCVFLEEARLVLGGAERMVQRAQAAASGEVGRVCLGYSPALSETAGRLISEFAHDRQGVQVAHRQEYTLWLVSAVEEGKLDAAFVYTEIAPEHLCAEPVRNVPLVCLVGDRHPLASRSSVGLEEMASYPFALPDIHAASFWPEILRRLLDRHGLHPELIHVEDPIGAFPRDSPELVWLLPAEHHLSNSVMVPVEPTEPISFSLLWHGDRVSPSLRMFVDYVRAVRDEERWLERPPGPPPLAVAS
jgi:DNA-binding transcriptional LysR family regulator